MDYRHSIPAAVFLLIAIMSFFILKSLLITIFVGAVLAYSIHPLYLMVRSRLRRDTAAAFLSCLLVLMLFLVPSFLMVKGLVKESYSLYLFAKESISPQIVSCQNWLCENIKSIAQNEAVLRQIKEFAGTIAAWIVAKGSALLVSIPRLLLHLFILFFTLFYFLRDGQRLVESIGGYLQLQKSKYDLLLRRLGEIIQGVVYGYLLIALVQGILGGLGFWLFGLSSPLFWGLVMAFLSLIPYLGTGLIWLPAALFMVGDGLIHDSTGLVAKGVGLALYGIIVVSSADNILRPRLMGKKAGIHPLVMFLGLVGGVFTFGPIGVLLGPLVLSLMVVILDLFVAGKVD